MTFTTPVSAVYGPVSSWRFGQSLGIDLIGAVSTCSFNCRYCQLGTIEHITAERQHFVPTQKIRTELEQTTWTDVDVVTLSGSGEPTLALNLGEVIQMVQEITSLPVIVLTNGTLLGDRAVQQALLRADKVAIKLDAVSSEYWRALNRPVSGLSLEAVLAGLVAFRQRYPGHLAIQTMVMEPWSKSEERRYVALLEAIQPDEVQLNTPLRSRPITHEIEARGNTPEPEWRHPQHVTLETLATMGVWLQAAIATPVRYPGCQA